MDIFAFLLCHYGNLLWRCYNLKCPYQIYTYDHNKYVALRNIIIIPKNKNIKIKNK